jgi:hypothetical protein
MAMTPRWPTHQKTVGILPASAMNLEALSKAYSVRFLKVGFLIIFLGLIFIGIYDFGMGVA